MKRLMVCMPPRHGKSMFCSQYFPAWYLGTFPDRRVILTSYGASFAAEWGRKARNILEEHGPSVFGVRLSRQSSAADRWDIEGREGGMLTAGVGGDVTGRGAHVLIVDDPVKNDEEANSKVYRDKTHEWYKSTAYTRLEPGGAVILIMTRWHRDDLAGRLLAEGDERGEPWTVVNLPALAHENDLLGRGVGDPLWPARYDHAALQDIRLTLGDYWWSALYDQNPGDPAGSEWPDSYFGPQVWVESWPKDLTLKTIGLDPSKGKDAKYGDFSCFWKLGRTPDGTLYCEADMSQTRNSTQIVEDGCEMCRQFVPDGLAVETNQFQELLADEFERVSRLQGVMVPIYCVENMVNKNVRIRRWTPYLSRGVVRFVATKGTRIAVEQMRGFPNHDHDDGPDAGEMALRLMIQIANERWEEGQRR